MAKKTTIKTINLQYGDVRKAIATEPANYTVCQGILKGLTLETSDPDAKTIDSEIFSNPFATIYQGKPIVMKFELTNYDLADLPDLIGGAYTAGKAATLATEGTPATAATANIYDAPDDITPTNHEWKISFQSGFDSLVIFNGLTIGVAKKDAEGALNYQITITAQTLTLGDNNYSYRINDRVVGA